MRGKTAPFFVAKLQNIRVNATDKRTILAKEPLLIPEWKVGSLWEFCDEPLTPSLLIPEWKVGMLFATY